RSIAEGLVLLVVVLIVGGFVYGGAAVQSLIESVWAQIGGGWHAARRRGPDPQLPHRGRLRAPPLPRRSLADPAARRRAAARAGLRPGDRRAAGAGRARARPRRRARAAAGAAALGAAAARPARRRRRAPARRAPRPPRAVGAGPLAPAAAPPGGP